MCQAVDLSATNKLSEVVTGVISIFQKKKKEKPKAQSS